MTKVELFHQLFSIHPENVQGELERLLPIVKEYEKLRDDALFHFQQHCEGVEHLKRRIADLDLYAKALKEIETKTVSKFLGPEYW